MRFWRVFMITFVVVVVIKVVGMIVVTTFIPVTKEVEQVTNTEFRQAIEDRDKGLNYKGCMQRGELSASECEFVYGER